MDGWNKRDSQVVHRVGALPLADIVLLPDGLDGLDPRNCFYLGTTTRRSWKGLLVGWALFTFVLLLAPKIYEVYLLLSPPGVLTNLYRSDPLSELR
jgi:hypothetical protein